ncbi:MAG TPA: phage holin family protein [Thermoanaerobaculia bacterium]
MIGLLFRWLLNTLALLVVAILLRPHIQYRDFVSLAIAALVLGLLNAIVKPILFILTLPLTILTLGLFLLVLNAIILEITSALVPGFTIESFGWAFAAAIVLALVSLVTNRIGAVAQRRD